MNWFAFSGGETPEVLMGYAERGEQLLQVVQHKNATADVLAMVYNSRAFKDDEQLSVIVNNPNCPTDVAVEVWRNCDNRDRYMAMRTDCPSWVLAQIAAKHCESFRTDSSSFVLVEVLKNGNTTADTVEAIRIAMKYIDNIGAFHVVNAIAENGKRTPRQATPIEDTISGVASRVSKKGWDVATMSLLDMVQYDRKGHYEVVRNANTPTDVLEYISKNNTRDADIRYELERIGL